MKKIGLIMALFAGVISLSANTEKLNVLLVLTDDQGYGDLSCNGNPYLSTPTIDKLSQESCNFTNYHSGTTCAPTRSGLMSAMYCNKAGVWHTIMGRSLLDLKRETVAEVFNRNGYATGMFGKWHLGDEYPYRPFDRGFETVFWHKAGGMGQGLNYWDNSYFDPTLYDKDTPVKTKGFCTDVLFDSAIEFMKKSQDEGRAFFCYLALNAAHGPFVAPEKYTKKFAKNKAVPSAGFYGMIENIDDNMAKAEEFLKASGLDKNTIVIFTTDNGSTFGAQYNKNGEVVVGWNAGMKEKKSSVYEGGHRVPFFMKIPNVEAFESTQLMGYIDVAPTLYDLCGISTDRKLDGISIKSVIDDPKSVIDRYLLGDTQRQENMSKKYKSVVMKGSMRLVNRKELYDVSTDIGQKNDISSKYPELVEEFLKVHDEYWDYIAVENDIIHPVYLAAPDKKSLMLHSHDKHISPLWAQSQVKEATNISTEGFWYAKAPEDGIYTFEIMRWAPESGLNIKDKDKTPIADKESLEKFLKKNKNGRKTFEIFGGELIIGDKISLTKKLEKGENPVSIKFENIELKAGEYKLFANYITGKKKLGAYYLKVTKQD